MTKQTLHTGKSNGLDLDYLKMAIELVSTDDVLRAIQMRGPLMPLDVRKFLGKGDSITIGATLSQLTASGKVKVTNLKRGGSPFYYILGQEPKIENLYNNLKEKDQRTFHLLKEKKILRDKTQDPLVRVSLREIKDFSKMFNVTVNNEQETFWRYYLISEQEAIRILKEKYAPKKPAMSEESKLIKKKTEVLKQKELKPKREKQEREEQKSLDPKYEEPNIFETVDDDFLSTLKKFFDKNEIEVKEAKMIRKGSEYDFVIEMRTPIGTAEYFCKAKSKKKCNDGDLSTAYIQGQSRRIPTVFITTGEVTKKARENMKTSYKGMLLKKI